MLFLELTQKVKTLTCTYIVDIHLIAYFGQGRSREQGTRLGLYTGHNTNS